MNYWITSDQHYGHRNIIKAMPDSRPFTNVDDMNQTIIDRHNSVVGKGDIVYMLGDFALGMRTDAMLHILSRLNGIKCIVYGNHDQKLRRALLDTDLCVSLNIRQTVDYLRTQIHVDHAPVDVIMMHFPIAMWDKKHYGSYHLHGHSHGRYNAPGRIHDVGVDTNNLYPYNLRDLIRKLSANDY